MREAAPIVRCHTLVSFRIGRGVLTPDEYVHSDSGMAEIHSLREKTVREDITRRLRRVCSNFSDDEFERLVKLMVARQVRCERRQSW